MLSVLVALLAATIQHGCDVLVGNAPMDLYGEVVDQTGKPAPEVAVEFEANARTPLYFLTTIPMNGDVKTWRVHAVSGVDGKFALHAGWGRVLFLKSIHGAGYTQSCLYLSFDYGRNPASPPIHTNPAHPATFTVWNDKYKRIISREVKLSVAESWYTVAYRSGRVSPIGTGDENLEFRIKRDVSKGAPSWTLEVDGFHGDIEAATEPMGPQAPEKGYMPTLRFTDWQSGPDGSRTIHVRLYSRGPDVGPNAIGKVFASVEMTITMVEARPTTATVRYTANFGNSRDLVPGPANAAIK